MTYKRRIVCFANSWKRGGSCVAGRDISNGNWGAWIRPVSVRPTHEVSFDEQRYQDGAMPALLDVIDVPLKRPQPQSHQQENHLLDDGAWWARHRVMPWAHLKDAVEDPGGPLWKNGFSSSKGTNDRVPERLVDKFSRSLYLIRPNDFRVVIGLDGYTGNRKMRARFSLHGEGYCLSLTDPIAESRLSQRPDGEVPVSDVLICVSLSEVLNGYAYKLVASVIAPPAGA